MTTEEVVAPLDAYATAKPDEPTFTLQGGDPLAAPLVRLWTFFARRRAMTLRIEEKTFGELIEAAIGHEISDDDDRERDNLLVRATAAEQVSWAMDAYVKGHHDTTDKPTEADDTHIDELARIDLHKARLHAAEKVSYMRGDLQEILVELLPSWLAAGGGSEVEAMMPELRDLIDRLGDIYHEIEPRRLFRKD
jgi:hypothetical protein